MASNILAELSKLEIERRRGLLTLDELRNQEEGISGPVLVARLVQIENLLKVFGQSDDLRDKLVREMYETLVKNESKNSEEYEKKLQSLEATITKLEAKVLLQDARSRAVEIGKQEAIVLDGASPGSGRADAKAPVSDQEKERNNSSVNVDVVDASTCPPSVKMFSEAVKDIPAAKYVSPALTLKSMVWKLSNARGSDIQSRVKADEVKQPTGDMEQNWRSGPTAEVRPKTPAPTTTEQAEVPRFAAAIPRPLPSNTPRKIVPHQKSEEWKMLKKQYGENFESLEDQYPGLSKPPKDDPVDASSPESPVVCPFNDDDAFYPSSREAIRSSSFDEPRRSSFSLPTVDTPAPRRYSETYELPEDLLETASSHAANYLDYDQEESEIRFLLQPFFEEPVGITATVASFVDQIKFDAETMDWAPFMKIFVDLAIESNKNGMKAVEIYQELAHAFGDSYLRPELLKSCQKMFTHALQAVEENSFIQDQFEAAAWFLARLYYCKDLGRSREKLGTAVCELLAKLVKKTVKDMSIADTLTLIKNILEHLGRTLKDDSNSKTDTQLLQIHEAVASQLSAFGPRMYKEQELARSILRSITSIVQEPETDSWV